MDTQVKRSQSLAKTNAHRMCEGCEGISVVELMIGNRLTYKVNETLNFDSWPENK
jgi:hypothetical protein